MKNAREIAKEISENLELCRWGKYFVFYDNEKNKPVLACDAKEFIRNKGEAFNGKKLTVDYCEMCKKAFLEDKIPRAVPFPDHELMEENIYQPLRLTYIKNWNEMLMQKIDECQERSAKSENGTPEHSKYSRLALIYSDVLDYVRDVVEFLNGRHPSAMTMEEIEAIPTKEITRTHTKHLDINELPKKGEEEIKDAFADATANTKPQNVVGTIEEMIKGKIIISSSRVPSEKEYQDYKDIFESIMENGEIDWTCTKEDDDNIKARIVRKNDRNKLEYDSQEVDTVCRARSIYTVYGLDAKDFPKGTTIAVKGVDFVCTGDGHMITKEPLNVLNNKGYDGTMFRVFSECLGHVMPEGTMNYNVQGQYVETSEGINNYENFEQDTTRFNKESDLKLFEQMFSITHGLGVGEAINKSEIEIKGNITIGDSRESNQPERNEEIEH